MRLEIRPSNGHRYIVAVQDVREGRSWRKRVVKSFGNIDDSRAHVRAAGFADAIGLEGLSRLILSASKAGGGDRGA